MRAVTLKQQPQEPPPSCEWVATANEMAERLNMMSADVDKRLPPKLRGQTERIIRRAALYFSRRADLGECTADSFVKCFLDAAELGLALDGKLAHAVPYWDNESDDNGNAKPVRKAQLMVDYKGLVAVARRTGVVEDAYAELVCANDEFEHEKTGLSQRIRHTWDANRPRGDVVAAYAVAIVDTQRGLWRYELMGKEELEAVRNRSKAKSGPWSSALDPREMYRKCPLRRLLKSYAYEDADMARAFEVDDEDGVDGVDGVNDAPPLSALTTRCQPRQPPSASDFDLSMDLADERKRELIDVDSEAGPSEEQYAYDPPSREDAPEEGQRPTDASDWEIAANDIAADIREAGDEIDLVRIRPRIEELIGKAPAEAIADLESLYKGRFAEVPQTPAPQEAADAWLTPPSRRR